MTGWDSHPSGCGLYIHIPFCKAKCRYCGFYSEPVDLHNPSRLCNALQAELYRYRHVNMQTAYIGGGSPSCLADELLTGLARTVRQLWPGIEEFSVECNPSHVDMDLLQGLVDTGVTRLSIGAQSFDQDQLRFLGRGHTADQIGQAVAAARKVGFVNIGIDLIYAIPGSTIRSWEQSLQKALDLDLQHISIYALSIEPGTPLSDAVTSGQIQPTDEDTDRAMYDLAIETLKGAGFEHYEISNLARGGFRCVHNIGYWLNNPYIGIGPAAASYWQGKRTANISSIEGYIEAIESGQDPRIEVEQVSELDDIWQTAVLNLRMTDGINIEWFRHRTGVDPLEAFAEPIGRYMGLGLIEVCDGWIRLNRQALAIADSILSDFVLAQV